MKRIRVAELMDDPGLEADRHRSALDGLRFLNRISGSADIVWNAIRPLLAASGGKPLRILDIATGGGDVPIELWKRARSAGVELDISGCDISPVALQYAQARATENGAAVKFFCLNALTDPLGEDFDILVCSLFVHHLDEEQVAILLSKMAQASRRMAIVNDLQRGALSMALVWLATRMLIGSGIVRVDGIRSVRAAYTLPEIAALATAAGWRNFQLAARFPCRYVLSVKKSA